MARTRDNLTGRSREVLTSMHDHLVSLTGKKAKAKAGQFRSDGALIARIRELRREVPPRIVRQVAEKALLQTDPVLMYDEILMMIHAEFECATSVACLRWYAVHMRERGERVPQRPKVGSK